MTVALPPDLEQFVENEIASGRYGSEDELLCDALRLLRARRLQRLRKEIRIGIDQLDRGEGTQISSDEELAAFFDEIEAEVQAELQAERNGMT